MRFNLLPNNERILRLSEYRIGVITVLFFALSVSLIIGTVMQIPAFSRVYEEKVAADSALQSVKVSPETAALDAVKEKVSLDQKLLTRLKTPRSSWTASDVVEKLTGLRGTLRYNSLVVENAASSSALVVVSGAAPTRDALLSFKSRVESVSKVDKVDIPIEELAKSSDVAFTVRVMVAMP